MKSKLACLITSGIALVVASVTCGACGGSTPTAIDGADSGTNNDSGSNGDGAANDGSKDKDGASNPDSGVGTCNAQTVNLTFGKCPSPPTCGGAIVDGIYDYTTGCIPDPWAQARMNCQALKVSNEQGTVKGCITFASGNAARNVQSTYGATLDVPTVCLLGGTCTQLATALGQYFTKASCSQSSTGCTCMVSTSYSAMLGDAYTTSNNQIVTSTNNKYNYCVNGTTLGSQWASGPSPEPGIYSLTKQ